jgi:N-acetylglucosamine-6-phosphate deacetylase
MTDSGLITNARLMTSNGRIENGWLRWRDGRIEAFGAGDSPQADGDDEIIDAGGKTVLPGFIDVHVHGGDGFEAMDGTHESLHGMARFYARHGVTAFLATTWTESRERIDAALLAIAGARGTFDDGATLLGAHVEGPYLNPKKCGAQSIQHIRRANPDEALAWLDLGVVRLLALAPEFEENHWLIRECVGRGIVVSAAHTDATYEQMRGAVDMGVRQATHTFNAMVGLHHREPGTVGAALALDDLNCELIADNIHVHPAVLKIAYRAKGTERLILITDAVRGAGLPPGLHQLDDRTVTIDPDSSVRLPDGTLAGSTLTMERALHNLMAATGESLETLWRASSLNAACALGIDDRKGSIKTGKDADLALVDDEMNVALTMAEGRVIFRK